MTSSIREVLHLCETLGLQCGTLSPDCAGLSHWFSLVFIYFHNRSSVHPCWCVWKGYTTLVMICLKLENYSFKWEDDLMDEKMAVLAPFHIWKKFLSLFTPSMAPCFCWGPDGTLKENICCGVLCWSYSPTYVQLHRSRSDLLRL